MLKMLEQFEKISMNVANCLFQVYDGGMEGLKLHPGSGFTDEITPAVTLTANTGRMLVKFVSDGSDEAECGGECDQGYLACGDGTCVDSRRRCDGHRDCDGGGDETGCLEHECEDWQIKCVR